MVQIDRKERRREARREEILLAARALAEADGVTSLTVKGLADHLDCAVGTIYTYFESKGTLVAALQADAIVRLTEAYDQMVARLEPLLEPLDPGVRRLARLVAFGRAIIVAERKMPREFHLQQELLSGRGEINAADIDLVTPIAFNLLARPQGLLEDAANAGGISGGASLERTVGWLAAINGVLVLSNITRPGSGGLFDTESMADHVTLDLLRGWGAAPNLLDAAASKVPLDLIDRLFGREASSS